MKPKIKMITAFVLVALAQLLVPTYMVKFQADKALSGNEFNFKVSHGRTANSLQGKYIWLNFEASKYKIADKNSWENNHSVFVTFEKDSAGYAKITEVTNEKPLNSRDWVKASAFRIHNDSSSLRITYPFSNYYIPDGDSKEVQRHFNLAMHDSMKTISLKVHINENQFLAGELLMDGVSFSEVLNRLKK